MQIRSEQNYTCTDISGPETVEVQVSNDGRVVWLNVDGICRFRIQRIEQLVITDERPKQGSIENRPVHLASVHSRYDNVATQEELDTE